MESGRHECDVRVQSPYVDWDACTEDASPCWHADVRCTSHRARFELQTRVCVYVGVRDDRARACERALGMRATRLEHAESTIWARTIEATRRVLDAIGGARSDRRRSTQGAKIVRWDVVLRRGLRVVHATVHPSARLVAYFEFAFDHRVTYVRPAGRAQRTAKQVRTAAALERSAFYQTYDAVREALRLPVVDRFRSGWTFRARAWWARLRWLMGARRRAALVLFERWQRAACRVGGAGRAADLRALGALDVVAAARDDA
jgi:hypothetical protein